MISLVTGGAGFIGSHLVDKLLQQGDEVIVIDDLSTGKFSNLKKNKRLSFYPTFYNTLIIGGLDRVFHLASDVGFFKVLKDPNLTIERNITETKKIIDACIRWKKPILFTSSSEVYGDEPQYIMEENDPVTFRMPINVRHCYSLSKMVCEYMITNEVRKKRLQAVIVRLFNTSGPRQLPNYGMVLPRFVIAALKNEPLIIYGDGQQMRTFCHVDDVVDAISLLAEKNIWTGEVYNVGSGYSELAISINNLAFKVISITKSKSEIHYKNRDKDYGPGFLDINYRMPTIKKIYDATKWRPEKRISEIIEDMVEYWKNKI